MIKYSLLTLILINLLWANEENIKNDNTVIINVDDYGISTEYPLNSNESKELAVIIHNRSKYQYLISFKKNNKNTNFISIPALENYSKTISIGQNEVHAIRPLSPPSEDIKLNKNNIQKP